MGGRNLGHLLYIGEDIVERDMDNKFDLFLPFSMFQFAYLINILLYKQLVSAEKTMCVLYQASLHSL